jgi:hypothetical protein
MVTQRGLKPEGNAKEYSRAFLVGWRLAQLYASPIHPEDISVVFTKDGYLPEIPENFTPPQQVKLIWTGLRGALEELPGGTSQEIANAITSLEETLQDKEYKEGYSAGRVEVQGYYG